MLSFQCYVLDLEDCGCSESPSVDARTFICHYDCLHSENMYDEYTHNVTMRTNSETQIYIITNASSMHILPTII